MPKIKLKKEVKNKSNINIRKNSNNKNDFMYYPTLEDENFYKNIYSKKEFHKNIIPKQTKTIEELCNPTEFTLLPQQNFLKNYISIETPYNGVLVFHSVGTGKCHQIDTPIMMANGGIKMVQDIKVGDKVMGDDSAPRLVTSLARGIDEMYKIKQSIGNDYVVNSEHILCLKNFKNNTVEISVKKYLEMNDETDKDLMGYKYNPFDFSEKKYKIKVIYIGRDNYYGFTVDGNHRYLLGDFTVTHNSCTAISIAEQFKSHMKNYKKKILVILKKNIQKGFIKQIYDLNKEMDKKKKDDVVQCTGDTYTLPEEDKYLSRDQKKRKIRSMIKQNYEFVGYEQFANEVKRKTDWDGDIKNLTPENIKKIDREYSNRIIIIDEVHHINVKSVSDVNIKKVPPILETIVQYSKNVRLILMSATPMFDKPEEIIYLLNLLLLNDKRDPIRITDVFDSSGNLKPNGDKILREASRGYISYMRGENPITFPIRLYAPQSVVPKIKYDIKGNLLKKDDRIKYLKLILCPMSDYQYKWYNNTLKGTKNFDINSEENLNAFNETNNNNSNNDNSNNDKNKKRDIGLINLIYISNIVYPTRTGEGVYAKYGITKSDDGNGALYEQTQIVNKRKRVTYRYQSHVIFNKGTKEEEPFLDIKYLSKYSEKFYQCLKSIINAKGIVFIYTRYLPGGVIPFALTMEQNGIQRYEADGDKQLLDYKSNVKGGGGKTNPICFYCGKFASDSIHKPENPNYHKWYSAKYMLLTGSKNLTKIDIGKAQDIINNKDNTYGQQVKIILGNEAVSEGIDFHRIRQVHILEPWYNISSLEQIMGRAIRNCSHKALEEKNRNVEIFLYASTSPKNSSLQEKETETIDENRYRISEIKDIKVKNVERILKESAIDCMLNKNANIHTNEKEINIETSSGHKIKYKLGDKPYSRECDYQENCNYKCNWELSKGETIKINEDTYNLIFAKSDINLAKKYIKKMYRKNIIYDLGYIIKNVKQHIPTIEDKYVYKALDEIVKNKDELVYDKYNREGYIIYRGRYYIFQPKEVTDETIPLYYRNVPITSKTKNLPLISYTFNKNVDESIEEVDIMKKIEDEIKEYGNTLEKTIKMNNISIDDSFFVILGMVLDRLPENDTVKMLKDLIIKHNKKNIDNKIEKKIIEYYVNNIFFNVRAIDKKKRLASEILGFKYHNKYYCLKNSSWSICSDDVRKRMEILNKIITKKEEKKDGLLMGLIAYDKNKEVILKIINRKKYIEAITLKNKKSKRAEITGRVCSSHDLSILYEIRSELKMKNVMDKGKKPFLCLEIEFFFRLKDDTDTTRKWLYDEIKN